MKKMSLCEYKAAFTAQGVPREHFAMICPMCGTIQSAHDLIAAGAGKDFDEVEGYLGFSCVGRFKKAPSPRQQNDGNPCNWTLGGLFQTHKLIVTVGDDEYPRFEPATPEQAMAHMKGGA